MLFRPFGHPALPDGAPRVNQDGPATAGCDVGRAGRRRTPSSFTGHAAGRIRAW
ncbi:hypothetical protein ACFY3N_20700 [Streptomyces sp. NPDC000348]|uniref:hypothetical protein n=1 Tax=Streptomyces sp. NPDC000348 TaxID=3364538 RepID=UPI0036AE2199